MVGRLEVLGRVLVFRRVAAAYVSAGKAKPQVDPGVTQFHTVFADVLIGGSEFDLISMFAVHSSLTSFLTDAKLHLGLLPTRRGPIPRALRRLHRCFAEIPLGFRAARMTGGPRHTLE